ncbi:hypothetical protein DRO24_02405 [Candidatus Bathyarchaeota archaeon]|nr:MAG: hypothetical protein DRO24_02405 [Candidatus Bathyarchaeota archaeon]
MKGAEKVWWGKVLASIVIAILTIILQLNLNIPASTLLPLGVVIYIIVSDLLSVLSAVDRRKGIRIGIFTYFILWITTWIFLYTYLTA